MEEGGKIKSVEDIKYLVMMGANLATKSSSNNVIWHDLSVEDLNRILKILPDGYVIDGNINLMSLMLVELPDFSSVVVNGCFDCGCNKLTSLKGAPQYVTKHFYCQNNKLTSFKMGA